MKVILLQDVKSVGKKGDIVEVSDGYAKNFIFKKKLGTPADPKNLNDLKLKKANDEKVAAENLEAAKELAEKIAEKTVVVSLKAGEGGKPFGSVSSKEIAQEAKDQFGLDIDKKKIVLAEPIRAFGTHEVAVKLHPSVTAALKVKVEECR
ncbi:MAG: 50S ribosomal protein L9 [Lachnospiraceae bacterium]|nr:50S ribosomal protein L9 [Lachnospiraceae bacterium]MBR4574411.1 50S ribosomal protein L9 [Lachnospiraceae bacterium]